MSTSNQQRLGGRRQPFGSLNANTLPSAKDPSVAASASSSASTGASDPVKAESKKKFRGVLASIITRERGGGSRSQASEGGEDTPASESLTSKTVVAAAGGSNLVATTAPPSRPQPQDVEFAASDVADIFRHRPEGDFWDMEDMLVLKPANPITDDREEEKEEQEDCDATTERRVNPSRALLEELDENVSGVHISWSSRVHEDKDGFKIHVDR